MLQRRNPNDIGGIVESGAAELLDRRGERGFDERRLDDIVGVLLDDMVPLIAKRILVRRLLQFLESFGRIHSGADPVEHLLLALVERGRIKRLDRRLDQQPQLRRHQQRPSAALDALFGRSLEERSRLCDRHPQTLPHERRLRGDGGRRVRIDRLGGSSAGVRLFADARMLRRIPILQQPAGEELHRQFDGAARRRFLAERWRVGESQAAPRRPPPAQRPPWPSAAAAVASPPCLPARSIGRP